ncbi:cupin domain-containing protein [Acidaminococcus massiliensis]|uniref:cupin domain-containing protein n=2 Tax=Acidaminococcus massiliensis TaxID=1852375 RepID=UPI00352002BC
MMKRLMGMAAVLAALTDGKKVPVVNVTFYKGAHTYWHRHYGTCQILVGASGHGYYQIWGQAPQKLEPGQTVTIPERVKRWHGAAPGQIFQHVVVMEPGSHTTEWLESVDDALYQSLD